MKALFFTLHRINRSPGQRYRHEQYTFHLEDHQITCHFSPLLPTQKADSVFYGNRLISKIGIGLNALSRRFFSVLEAGEYDVVYIYRDAFFFGAFFERWLKRKKVKIIYDFDDAIWLMDKNENQGFFNWLKTPGKVAIICKMVDQVVVGNKYLAQYARQFNPNVTIIPSTIDMRLYGVPKKENGRRVCIGWTGSFSTIKHFETALPALKALKEKYGDRVYFKVIGVPDYKFAPLDIQDMAWSAEKEAEDPSELDIGLMPLPDNEWTRGKCSMKALQYMALGIPAVISPVGMNNEVVQDGVNGFLADGEEEWVEKLSRLMEDAALRKKLGEAGRQTVIEKYSVEANKEKWLAVFGEV